MNRARNVQSFYFSPCIATWSCFKYVVTNELDITWLDFIAMAHLIIIVPLVSLILVHNLCAASIPCPENEHFSICGCYQEPSCIIPDAKLQLHDIFKCLFLPSGCRCDSGKVRSALYQKCIEASDCLLHPLFKLKDHFTSTIEKQLKNTFLS